LVRQCVNLLVPRVDHFGLNLRRLGMDRPRLAIAVACRRGSAAGAGAIQRGDLLVGLLDQQLQFCERVSSCALICRAISDNSTSRLSICRSVVALLG